MCYHSLLPSYTYYNLEASLNRLCNLIQGANMQQKIQAFNSMKLIEQIEAIKSVITDTNHLFLVDKNEEKCFIFLDDEKKNPTILFSQTNEEYPIFGVAISKEGNSLLVDYAVDGYEVELEVQRIEEVSKETIRNILEGV